MLIGYARVSTDDQNLDLQRDALTQAGCERIFEDVMSGAKSERPGLEEALRFIREGDALCVWRLDRLGRSLPELIRFVGEIETKRANFVSLTEKFDTQSAGGRLFFHVFAAFADFERQLIIERTRAGLVAARARGKRGGRPALLNSEKIETGRVLRAANQTDRAIASTLGVSVSTVRRHCK